MKSIIVFNTPDRKSKNLLGMEIDATCKNALKGRSKPIKLVIVNLLEIEAKV